MIFDEKTTHMIKIPRVIITDRDTGHEAMEVLIYLLIHNKDFDPLNLSYLDISTFINGYTIIDESSLKSEVQYIKKGIEDLKVFGLVDYEEELPSDPEQVFTLIPSETTYDELLQCCGYIKFFYEDFLTIREAARDKRLECSKLLHLYISMVHKIYNRSNDDMTRSETGMLKKKAFAKTVNMSQTEMMNMVKILQDSDLIRCIDIKTIRLDELKLKAPLIITIANSRSWAELKKAIEELSIYYKSQYLSKKCEFKVEWNTSSK